MKRTVILIASILVYSSCANHDVKKNTKEAAMSYACRQCNKSAEEMEWFSTLLDETEAGASQGDLYVISLDNQAVIVHQPHIMSCLGCLVYDCSGQRVDHTTTNFQKIAEEMTPRNRVFSVPLY